MLSWSSFLSGDLPRTLVHRNRNCAPLENVPARAGDYTAVAPYHRQCGARDAGSSDGSVYPFVVPLGSPCFEPGSVGRANHHTVASASVPPAHRRVGAPWPTRKE